MQEQIISFEIAILAKEKGFNTEFASYYNILGELLNDIDFPSLHPTKPKYWYSAPTQSLLQKWLREEYNISISVITHYPNIQNYAVYKTIDPFVEFTSKNRIIGTYEEALEKGLHEALLLI